jgi:hypothetical protein
MDERNSAYDNTPESAEPKFVLASTSRLETSRVVVEKLLGLRQLPLSY